MINKAEMNFNATSKRYGAVPGLSFLDCVGKTSSLLTSLAERLLQESQFDQAVDYTWAKLTTAAFNSKWKAQGGSSHKLRRHALLIQQTRLFLDHSGLSSSRSITGKSKGALKEGIFFTFLWREQENTSDNQHIDRGDRYKLTWRTRRNWSLKPKWLLEILKLQVPQKETKSHITIF